MVWVATKSGEVISHMLLTLVFFLAVTPPSPTSGKHCWLGACGFWSLASGSGGILGFLSSRIQQVSPQLSSSRVFLRSQCSPSHNPGTPPGRGRGSPLRSVSLSTGTSHAPLVRI